GSLAKFPAGCRKALSGKERKHTTRTEEKGHMCEPWKDSPEDDGVPEHLRFAVDLPDLDKMEPDEQIEFLREYLRKLREHRDEVAAAGVDIDALLMAGARQLDVADA